MLEESVIQSYLDLGGTIRSRPIDSTILWLKPFFEKLGITRIANITGLDCLDVPVAICIRPNSKHLAVSQGKGITWKLAIVSAIMEAIEGYHVENTREPILHGAYSDLIKKYAVIEPTLFVPGAFTLQNLTDWSMGWSEAIDINNANKSVFIPHALTCLDTTLQHPEYSFLSVSTNGLAAGNSKEEAMCHALYEVIERDSLFRWAKSSEENIAKTQLKLDTVDSKINKDILSKFEASNQLVKVWDITSELGIPSFHCVIKDTNLLRSLGMFRGTGTHLLKEVALSRAMTEAAQSRLTVISGVRDDIFNDQYNNRSSFSYSQNEYYGMRNYADCYQPIVETSFQHNIKNLCNKLSEQGFKQVFVVDHTKPELNIPVVQIFIPSMQYNGIRI